MHNGLWQNFGRKVLGKTLGVGPKVSNQNLVVYMAAQSPAIQTFQLNFLEHGCYVHR